MNEPRGYCAPDDGNIAQSHIFQYAIEHGSVPLSVMLELTRRCCLSCPHCYQDRQAAVDEMDGDELRHLIFRMADMGTLFLTLTGGEASTHPRFWDVLRWAADLRFVLKVKTSAARMTPDDARRMREMGVSELHVSLYHHDPARHDDFVCEPGAYGRALAAMRAFRDAGGRVQAMTLLMNWNLDAALPLQSLYRKEGFLHTFDFRLEPMEDGDGAPLRFMASADDLARLIPQIDFLRDQLEKQARAKSPDDGICSIGLTSAYIAANGDVYPCSVARSLHLGNVRTQSLDDIWMSEKRQRLTRLRWGNSPQCTSCTLSAFCHRCPVSAAVEHGDVTRPASTDCELARVRQMASHACGAKSGRAIPRKHKHD